MDYKLKKPPRLNRDWLLSYLEHEINGKNRFHPLIILRLLPAFTCFYVSPKIFYGAENESVILKDPEIDSVKSIFSSGALAKTTGATKPNVRIHIRRRIVQIQREGSSIHPIIPIAATDGREAVDSSP